jgi:hypothetical protein
VPHLKSLSTPVRNEFADALHKEGLILTVFIAGCCGWADPNTTAPAGHCADAVATHDFCGATCLDWRNSSVDWVLSGATYSGTMRNSARSPRGADNLKALVGNAARGELHALCLVLPGTKGVCMTGCWLATVRSDRHAEVWDWYEGWAIVGRS